MSWENAVSATITGGVALTIGWWTLKRGRQGDAATEKLAAQTETRATRIQTIGELETIIDALKSDNARLIENVDRCGARLDVMEGRLDTQQEENIALRTDIARLRRKYGENGTTPPNGQPPTPT